MKDQHLTTENQKNKTQAGLRMVLLVLLSVSIVFLLLQMLLPGDEQPSQVLPTASVSPAPAQTESMDDYTKDTLLLQQLISDDKTDEETRKQAGKRLEMMIWEHDTQLGLEKAMHEAGIKNAAVLIQNGALTVIVDKKDAGKEKSAALLALCAAHTDIGVENMRIMTRDEQE